MNLCPKCNAGTSRKAGHWICGTSSNTHGGGVTESIDCLRHQLAQARAEIERLTKPRYEKSEDLDGSAY